MVTSVIEFNCAGDQIPDAFAEDVYVFPASIAQRRFWTLDQLQPGDPALNTPIALRLKGTLDVVALEQTLNEILRRHESLRTTFGVEDGQLVQVITPSLTLALPTADLRDLPDSEREAEAERLTVEEARKSFLLDRGPLFRARLLRLGDDEHILLVTMHHIVCDGWSLGLSVRELGTTYEAFYQGRPSPLPEPSIQYADFSHWQQQWLQSADFEEQLQYWRRQLGGTLPVLNLPTDRPRRHGRTPPGAIQTLLLPESLTESLKSLCHREDATMFMVLLATFKTLLYRYTKQENILVGSPVANRNQVETESLIGLFVNVLLLRTDLSGDPTFREFLGRVREMALGAFAHHDVPFEKLAEDLRSDRNSRDSRLLNVMFIYQTAFMQPVELPALTLTPQRSVSPGAMFDLTQSVVERAEGLRLQLEYNAEVFEATTIARMLEHFQTLLEAVAADPDQRISDLSLLTETGGESSASEHSSNQAGRMCARCACELSEANEVKQTPEDFNVSPVRPVISVSDETRPETEREFVAPSGLLEHQLTQIWEEVLGVEAVGIRDNFFELGGHSLLAVRMIEQIERACGKRLPLTTLFTGATIEHLVNVLLRQESEECSPAVTEIQAGGSRRPFFFLHGDVDNGGLYCVYLARHLGEDQPFYALHPQGLDGQESLTTIEGMAAYHLKTLRAVQPEGPYLLGGFCNGALIAFEMARQLEKCNQKVDLLALIHASARNARYQSLQSIINCAALFFRLSSDKRADYFIRLRDLVARLSNMSGAEKIIFALGKVGKVKQVIGRFKPALTNKVTHDATSLKHDSATLSHKDPGRNAGEAYERFLRAVMSYVPRKYSGQVTLFWPEAEPVECAGDRTIGWREVAAGVEVHSVPGHHTTCVTKHAGTLAEYLRTCLQKLQPDESAKRS